MITCSNCAKPQNMNVQKLNQPLANNGSTYDTPAHDNSTYEMPNLMTPAPNMQNMPSTSNMPSAPNMPNDDSSPFTAAPFREYNPFLPEVFPDLENLPYFEVPANPLLPDGYQEYLDYNSVQYLNGFLRTQIGKIAEVEFLIGSNNMVTHTGRLIAVGVNFLILQELNSNSILTCDYYTIKFVRFYG